MTHKSEINKYEADFSFWFLLILFVAAMIYCVLGIVSFVKYVWF